MLLLVAISYLVLVVVAVLILGAIVLGKVMSRHSWWWKLPVRIVTVAMCLAAAVAGMGFLSLHFMRAEYVLPARPSPDGRRIARVTEFDCGAVSPSPVRLSLDDLILSPPSSTLEANG